MYFAIAWRLHPDSHIICGARGHAPFLFGDRCLMGSLRGAVLHADIGPAQVGVKDEGGGAHAQANFKTGRVHQVAGLGGVG